MKARCLETRLLPNGLKMRRYRREDGVDYKTIEMPIEVWIGINNQGRGNDRASAWVRARQREALRVQATELAAKGWKRIAIANELNVPERTIQRWMPQPAYVGQQRELQKRALDMLAEGWKLAAIANELGIPDRTVYRWAEKHG